MRDQHIQAFGNFVPIGLQHPAWHIEGPVAKERLPRTAVDAQTFYSHLRVLQINNVFP